MGIGEIADAVLQINFNYEKGRKDPEDSVVGNISIRDVTCRKAKYALNLRGFADAPIRNVRLDHCRFDNVDLNVAENVEGLLLNEVTISGKRV